MEEAQEELLQVPLLVLVVVMEILQFFQQLHQQQVEVELVEIQDLVLQGILEEVVKEELETEDLKEMEIHLLLLLHKEAMVDVVLALLLEMVVAELWLSVDQQHLLQLVELVELVQV